MSTVTGSTPDRTTDSLTTDAPDTLERVPGATREPDPEHGPTRRWVAVVVGLALTAVAVGVGVVSGAPSDRTDPPAAASTVDVEAAETERLQRLGLVPDGAAIPALSSAARERTITRSLIARGLVPAGTLEPTTERGHTQVLIVKGLIPDGS